MTDREAMKQALEALTCTGEDDDPGHRCGHCDDYVDRNGLVRAAIRAQLEQPEQEPTCPECKAAVLYECVACSSNNYPPQRKPLTDDMVHRAMIALNTASCGDLQPTFEEMRAALEAAHGIKGEA